MNRGLFVLLPIFCFFTFSIRGADFADYVGYFRLSSPDVPMVIWINVKMGNTPDKRTMTYDIKRSPYGNLTCSGNAERKGEQMFSAISCNSGALEYERITNLKDIPNFNKFSTSVYSGLYETWITTDFERL